jgi:hypothetical protein
MTTADVVRERVLRLATFGADREDAIRELEACSEGRRVAVVRARQQLLADDELEGTPAAFAAIDLLDELLSRLPA